MEWALAGIALAGFGFAATAIALAIQNGALRAERGKLDAALEGKTFALETLVESSRARADELAAVIEVRDERISALYAELESCGDDESRTRIAVDGIRLMLPTFEAEDAGDSGAQ